MATDEKPGGLRALVRGISELRRKIEEEATLRAAADRAIRDEVEELWKKLEKELYGYSGRGGVSIPDRHWDL